MPFGFDFGISEFFGGFRPKQTQQFRVGEGLRPAQLPAARRAVGQNTFRATPAPVSSNVFSGPVPKGASESVFRSTGKTVPSGGGGGGNKPKPKPSSGGNVAGSNDAQLSSDLQEALNRADAEGRFENLSGEARARAAKEFFAQKGEAESVLDEDFNAAIDEISNIEGLLGGQQDDLLGSIGSSFDTQRQAFEDARGQLLAENEASGVRQRQTAAQRLGEARNLFQELSQASRQRFGGGTSAGQFASQLTGREFQRQQGDINRTLQSDLVQLDNQRTSIRENYATQISQLEAQKRQALAEVRDQFNQRMAQVANARLELIGNRAQARQETLAEFRNRANQINDQANALRQNLISSSVQALQQLSAMEIQRRAELGGQVDLSQFLVPEFSGFGGGDFGGLGSLVPIGQLGRRREEENSPFAGLA